MSNKKTIMERLDILKKRLNRIGIEVEFAANYPWIYICKVNGKRVKETFKANHGFTVGFIPLSRYDSFHFTDLNEIFKLIRKYCH